MNNNEEEPKEEWHAPEIIDLDLDKTKSGVFSYSHESYNGS